MGTHDPKKMSKHRTGQSKIPYPLTTPLQDTYSLGNNTETPAKEDIPWSAHAQRKK